MTVRSKEGHINYWQGCPPGANGCSFWISSNILCVLFKMHWICSSKLNFNLKTNLSALELNLKNAIFIKIQYWVWLGTYFFWLNSSFGAGLKGSELKSIFHCTAHLEIFKKSCFRIIVFVVISCTVENSVLCKNFLVRLETVRQVVYVN